MRGFLMVLLMACSAVAHAQQAPFDEQHAEEKRLEQVAIGLRVQQNLKIASNRKEVQYAENRRRCKAAQQVAESCGKFAGTFYCDEKGFHPIAPDASVKGAVMDNATRFRMERCAQDAARRNR